MSSRPNPDDRSDNVEKIQKNIDRTILNIELAEDMISNTSDEKTRKDLQMKNERREKALDSLRDELVDETLAGEDGNV